jgi:hypothetical protein
LHGLLRERQVLQVIFPVKRIGGPLRQRIDSEGVTGKFIIARGNIGYNRLVA